MVSPTAFSIFSGISYAAAFGWVGVCGVAVAMIIAFKVEDVVATEKARRQALTREMQSGVTTAAAPADP